MTDILLIALAMSLLYISIANRLFTYLAKSIGVYFRLGKKEMDSVIDEVKSVVYGWQKLAVEIGIPRSEQSLMTAAFKV